MLVSELVIEMPKENDSDKEKKKIPVDEPSKDDSEDDEDDEYDDDEEYDEDDEDYGDEGDE